MSRIPPLVLDEDGAVGEWARELYSANLAFHLDDDPADIMVFRDGRWGQQFEPDEVGELRLIVAQLDDAAQEEYFNAIMDAYAESEDYFNMMAGPSREDSIRQALSGDIYCPQHPDDVTINEIARMALDYDGMRDRIADALDLSDEEITRLQSVLRYRAGPPVRK